MIFVCIVTGGLSLADADAARRAAMKKVNPKYVLRTSLAQVKICIFLIIFFSFRVATFLLCVCAFVDTASS